jgi:molybdate transport system ATP-binding protein
VIRIKVTLEFVNVTKTFPGFILGPINLKIKDNTILVLIGSTGSGKTTLLNLIIGLIKPDTGSIYLDGVDITNLPVESRKIGYSFQNPCLFPHLSVYENIMFGLKKGDRKISESQIKELLKTLGILHLMDRNIQGLSGGEMQKISLARMLITEPKIMLMDEPLAHLDNPTKKNLRVNLRRILKKQDVSGIYVTHFEDDVYALADSVSILKNGCIEKTDTLRSMLAYFHHVSSSSSSSSLTPSSPSEIFQGEYNYLEGLVIDSKEGVTTFEVGLHKFKALGNYPIDSIVGVMIKPEDIILSPEMIKTSARNIVRTRVVRMVDTFLRTGVMDIHLNIDDIHLLSRITNESKKYLGIEEGQYIYAIFKTTSPQIIREEKFD